MAIYQSKKPTKDGRSYFFRIKYKDIMGITHDYTSPKFKTKKEAVSEEAKYRLEVNQQKTNTTNPTFQDIFDEYLNYRKEKVKPQSLSKIEDKMKHLEPLKKIRVNDFNTSHYQDFLRNLNSKNLSCEYKNKILGILRATIKYSNKYYNTNETILKFIENYKKVNQIKKEMQFFTYEEYKQFDSVIDNFMHHTFFETLYFMGTRQGEAQALNWNDINFDKKELNINKTLTTKIRGEKWTISSPKTKNSTRVLPIPENLLNDLKTLKKQTMEYTDFKEDWFVFGNSLCFPENTIQINKNKYCRLANVKQIRVHDFRHSCASLLINKGASIALVSKYLGHSNISITLNTYTHMYKSELNQITSVLDNL